MNHIAKMIEREVLSWSGVTANPIASVALSFALMIVKLDTYTETI